jgi:hypothetical protein
MFNLKKNIKIGVACVIASLSLASTMQAVYLKDEATGKYLYVKMQHCGQFGPKPLVYLVAEKPTVRGDFSVSAKRHRSLFTFTFTADGSVQYTLCLMPKVSWRSSSKYILVRSTESMSDRTYLWEASGNRFTTMVIRN